MKYLILSIAVVVIFIFWVVMLWHSQKKMEPPRQRDRFTGMILFGPLYPYLQYRPKRDPTLSRREIFGIVFILLLMLVAFIFTFFQTKGTFRWGY
jgi:uncharacterized membrane protein